jgi:hypothetical protein
MRSTGVTVAQKATRVTNDRKGLFCPKYDACDQRPTRFYVAQNATRVASDRKGREGQAPWLHIGIESAPK